MSKEKSEEDYTILVLDFFWADWRKMPLWAAIPAMASEGDRGKSDDDVRRGWAVQL